MARNPTCTVYIGNLDQKVTDRILYEILIQVGCVVDLYIPQDKETNCHRGFAFAEYESEEIANYAVRLFSGIVKLYNKTLKFAISGQDKSSQNTGTPITPKLYSPPLPRPHAVHIKAMDMPRSSSQLSSFRVSSYIDLVTPSYPQAPAHGFVNNGVSSGDVNYGRYMFGSRLGDSSHSDIQHSTAYPSYHGQPIAYPSY